MATIMPIIRPSAPKLVYSLLSYAAEISAYPGVQIAGGYPLWLVGGSFSYADIDVYTNSQESYLWACELVDAHGKVRRSTSHSTIIRANEERYNIITPGYRAFTNEELLEMADLSPSACVLYLNTERQLEVMALYPEDIKNRVCRVLEEHPWTLFRTQQYRYKGYTIIWPNAHSDAG